MPVPTQTREPGPGAPWTPATTTRPHPKGSLTPNQATQSPSTVSRPTPALWQALNRHHQRLMKNRG